MGRLLTFPNTLQHRVSPFSLADRSKPGHRKILALFLIDPSRRVISTANVPPQREDWCNDWAAATNDVLNNRLPRELQAMVRENPEFPPMTMDEAKAYRVNLWLKGPRSRSPKMRCSHGETSLYASTEVLYSLQALYPLHISCLAVVSIEAMIVNVESTDWLATYTSSPIERIQHSR